MEKRKHRGVYENPAGSGIWWILYYADGVRHREKIGRHSAAINAYLARKSQIREQKFESPSRKNRIAFDELAKLLLADKKNRVSEFTYQNYETHLAHWSKCFGSTAAVAVSPARIGLELGELIKGRTNSTVNMYRISLGAVFTFGIRTGRIHLPKNPIAGVRPYKGNDPRVRYLLEDEEAALRDQIRELYPNKEPELDLALNTGMRRGEQYNLTWDKIDLDLGLLQACGKTGRRFLPINQSCRNAIAKLRELAPAGAPWVITDHDRRSRKDLRKWLELCIREAKLVNFKWHDLRHTFASRLVMRGESLKTVQELLGHKSILMTMRYAHLSQAHKAAAVAKLDGSNPAPEKIVPIRKKA